MNYLKYLLLVASLLSLVAKADFFANEAPLRETLKKNPQLSTFVTVADKLGILQRVEQKNGVTLIVPTNAAFDKIGAVIPKLSEQQLATILSRHVLNSALSSSLLEAVAKQGIIGTLASSTALTNPEINLNYISFGVDYSKQQAFFRANKIGIDKSNPPSVNVIDFDIKFNHGFIYVIDQVLLNSSELDAFTPN